MIVKFNNLNKVTFSSKNHQNIKHTTATTNSSARIFPKRRKLKDNGLVKSSKILIGK